MHSQRHNSFRNQSPVGGNVSKLRNHRNGFGNHVFVMPRSPRRQRSLSHDSVERRDLRGQRGGIVRSRSPPIGQVRRVMNYGNRSKSPPIMVNFGNGYRSPLVEHMRKMPSYGNRSRSPPIEHMRKMPIEHMMKMPGDGLSSRSPPSELMRKMPSYRIRSRSPPIQHPRKMPSYRIRSRSPPIEHSRKMPSYGNRSMSPPMEHIRKIPNYEVEVLRKGSSIAEMHGRSGTYEYMDVRSDANDGLNSTSRVIREGFDKILRPEHLELEDGSSRGIYRMPADIKRPLENFEASGNISLRSMNMGLDQFNDEKIQYPDLLEKPRRYMNDVPYTMVPPPQSLDSTGTPQFKVLGSTSSPISRGNFPVSRWDGPPLTKGPLLGKDDYLKGSAKLTEHMDYGDYRERLVFDSGRNPLGVYKDLDINKDQFISSRGSRDRKHYLCKRTLLGDSDVLDIGRDLKTGTITSSPSRSDPRNYLYSRPGIEETNNHISDEMYERYERMDYGSRPNMLDPDTNEFYHRYPSPQKQSLASHIGTSRSSIASEKYIETVASQGRKVSREGEVPYFDLSNDRNRMLPMTSKLDHARDAGPIYYKERIRSPEFYPDNEMHRHSEETMRSVEFHYDIEMPKHPLRAQGIRGEEHSTFYLSHRAPKRRHNTDEENYLSDSRDIPRDWNGFSRNQYEDDTSEDWIKQHKSKSYSSKRLAYEHEVDSRSRRFCSRTGTHWLSACEDHSSSYKREEHVAEHASKGQSSSDKYSKGYSKPGYASYHDSHQYSRNIVHHKSHNVRMKSEDAKKVDLQNEVFPLEKRETLAKSKPSEDSDEFKQLVHTHYLSFTRKLNDNYGVRRRYKEQGRAGSLFCIVCGRSESKEFTDTRRLATHAFMSHKVGLRTQHLGLHKAICVLLGWKSDVATDVVTWAPETISSAEALAQKEDLIIWPPVVVIQNSSASNHGISVEALENFIKGKGVNVGKVKSVTSNIMVVKFLGTYSGVQEAEKLHKYFTENKRGRVDFEKINPSKPKTSKIADKTLEAKFNELELYGYIGIAEDLDHVDFDTKKKCSIRSKKEIQDIVDAPVKTE